jgi:hypothetical protein
MAAIDSIRFQKHFGGMDAAAPFWRTGESLDSDKLAQQPAGSLATRSCIVGLDARFSGFQKLAAPLASRCGDEDVYVPRIVVKRRRAHADATG